MLSGDVCMHDILSPCNTLFFGSLNRRGIFLPRWSCAWLQDNFFQNHPWARFRRFLESSLLDSGCTPLKSWNVPLVSLIESDPLTFSLKALEVSFLQINSTFLGLEKKKLVMPSREQPLAFTILRHQSIAQFTFLSDDVVGFTLLASLAMESEKKPTVKSRGDESFWNKFMV